MEDATILFYVFCTWRSVSDEHPPRTKSTSRSSDWTSTAFVWSFAHVHELSRHRALRLRIACGYLASGTVLLSAVRRFHSM